MLLSPIILTIISSLLIYICLLIQIAYSTLLERKVMAAIQRRLGPNVLGVCGLGQPLADGLKLLIKETIIPSKSDRFLFIVAPIITFFLSLPSWSVIPLSSLGALVNISTSAVLIFMISSLGVYGVILGGWSSNSKYAVMGSIRSVAQMISYEVILGFTIMPVFVISKSSNLYSIALMQGSLWNVCCVVPASVLFFIGTLAETNRAPFDLPEAEAELVAGFNVEYSSLIFALFFLGEYANILLMSVLYSILFLGGWNFAFIQSFFQVEFSFLFEFLSSSLKVVLILFIFVWVRASFPRFRFDQLMNLCWVDLLMFSFCFLLVYCVSTAVVYQNIYCSEFFFNIAYTRMFYCTFE